MQTDEYAAKSSTLLAMICSKKNIRYAKALVLLAIQVFFLASKASAQNQPSSFDWSAHFKNPPIIKNCVFERLTVSDDGRSWKTNYYQFRYQTNGFFFRELKNLSDANEETISSDKTCVGYFETNAWSIEFGTLKRFLNLDLAKLRNGTYDATGNSSTIFVSERIAFATLFYGINNLDPQSLQWDGKSAFTAVTVYREKIAGTVDDMSGEWPSKIRLQKDGDPMGQLLEYKYGVNLSLPYFPSEISLFREWKDKKQLRALLRVFILETSGVLLGPEYFDSSRYFLPSADPMKSSMIFKGNDAFVVEKDGSLTLVEKPDMEAKNASTSKPKFFLLFGLFAALAILSLGVRSFLKRPKLN